jgi:AcrR family transcriptional regulator
MNKSSGPKARALSKQLLASGASRRLKDLVKTTAPRSAKLKRVRRAAAEMRAQALAAARGLIVEGGENALTMRAVADAAGVTYPNLSHHFGSAAGLHAAIAEDLVRELLAGLRLMGEQMDGKEHDYRRLVDRVFDLFDRDGLGRVLGWLVRSGETARLKPVNKLLSEFIAERSAGLSSAGGRGIARVALIVTFAAYAESSVGPLLGDVLGVSASARRRYFADAIAASRNL